MERVDQSILKGFGHGDKMDKERITDRVYRAGVNRARLRGISKGNNLNE